MDITDYQAATVEPRPSDGAKGDKGMVGSTGSRGQKGDAGKNGVDADHRNWKQCAWKSYDARDIGLIKVGIDVMCHS